MMFRAPFALFFFASLAAGVTVFGADAHAEESSDAKKTDEAAATQSGSLSTSALDLARRRAKAGDAFTLIVKHPKKGSRKKPSVTVMVGEASQPAPAPLAAAPRPTGNDVLHEVGPGDPIRSLVDISMGPSVMTRSFDYSLSPANTPNLRSYKLPAMAMVEANLDVFPAVGVDLPVVPDLGVSGHYGHSIDMPSLTADGRNFLSHSHRWRVGLLYRNRFGADKRLRLRGELGYGQQQFSLDAQDTRADQIATQAPNVNYQFIKVHGMLGYAFDPLTIWGGVAYLATLKGGPIYDQFRDPNLNGVDLNIRADVTIGEGFGLRVAGDYRRIFSRFSAEPGDAYVAGGALEQLVTGHLALRYVH